MRTKLKFRCAEGHEWDAWPQNIKDGGSWCTRCATRGNKRLTLADLRQTAAERGGECLSDKYESYYDSVTWRCSVGHVFRKTASTVRRKHGWCDECEGTRSRKGPRIDAGWCPEALRTIAALRGGQYLSGDGVNTSSNVTFDCGRGHRFTTLASQIIYKRQRWCPDCKYKSEALVRTVLEALTGKEFPKTRSQLYNSGLELDGYCDELRIAFEYQGLQHYQVVRFFPDSEEQFAQRVARDALKRELCHEKWICLLEIPYTRTANLTKLTNYLSHELTLLGVL